MEGKSEIFSSMDEVKLYAEALKPHLAADDYELLLYLFGLLENRGYSIPVTIDGVVVEIDKFLALIITALTQAGVKTLACCSGLHSEHPEGRFEPESGYLSIAFDLEVFKTLEHLTNEIIKVQKGESYLQPCISITLKSKDDKELKENWLLVWDALRLIYNIK